MTRITYVARDLTKNELERVWAGFKENELLHTEIHQTSERIGFVALDNETVIGCSTGLAYKNDEIYNGWFYLTDLFVEPQYRGYGYGRILLKKLEERLTALGIKKIWLWTAGFEAPHFYSKQGYVKFAELEQYYASGHSRIAMWKNL
jgi:ribosomal protein S18 acetylase RimI-like enzyme